MGDIIKEKEKEILLKGKIELHNFILKELGLKEGDIVLCDFNVNNTYARNKISTGSKEYKGKIIKNKDGTFLVESLDLIQTYEYRKVKPFNPLSSFYAHRLEKKLYSDLYKIKN